MARRGISTVVGIIILAAFVTVAAASVATFFQSALEDVQDGPDVGFDNALEVVHVSCIGHEMRLTIRNTGDKQFDASDARVYLYDGGGDLLQVTPEQDFSGKRFEQPDGVDTMTVTIPDAAPLTDTMPFDVAFNEEGVEGVCSPRYDNNLVAAWSFDRTERNGTHTLDVVNGHTAAIRGDPVFDADAGVAGDGGRFDGNDDFLEVQDLPSIESSISVAAWVRSTAGDTYTASWSAVSRYSQFILGPESGEMSFIVNTPTDGWTYLSPSTTPEKDTWHRFVGVWHADTGTVQLWMDGEKWAEASYTAENPSSDTGPVDIAHRESQPQGTDHLAAEMDDVRIYNRSLSAEEIAMDAVAPP